MKDFDLLKDSWNSTESGISENEIKKIANKKNKKSNKMKLQHQQSLGAILLILTAIFIAGLGIFGNFNFEYWYTYFGMALICLICLAEAGIMLFTFKKIKDIDETASPIIHLEQWNDYYLFRKKQAKWNMPLYYIALNLAIIIYASGIFIGRPWKGIIIFTVVYIAWMLFAYFYLGKKTLKKEDDRLNGIMSELKSKISQINQE